MQFSAETNLRPDELLTTEDAPLQTHAGQATDEYL